MRRRTGRFLTTAQVAAAVGVHPNTVRLYEAWGFLPPIPRGPNGYRRFTEAHLDLMRLARTALQYPYPGGKEPVLGLLERAKAGDLEGALELGRGYLDQVRGERAKAEEAVVILEGWARRGMVSRAGRLLRIGEAASLLETTVDALRHWERNGLIEVPQDPRNRYRGYGPLELDRLRVIRVLRSAGYSTMSILRMLRHLDEGSTDDLRHVLDTPHPDDDVIYWTDRWLSSLAEQERRAMDVIALLHEMLEKRG
ncbi:MAG TPA: MerR family transcriptional regulator [Chloroflexota bacterium]|nr:MerR family transcriptional regulator [Chloroflexota bacterium]